MVAMILQNSLGANHLLWTSLRACVGTSASLVVPSVGDLGQAGARDVALAASFITSRKSSGVMFVNTAAMCAQARGETPAWPGVPKLRGKAWRQCNVAKPSSASAPAGAHPSQPCGTPRQGVWRASGNLFTVCSTRGCVLMMMVAPQVRLSA